MAIGFAGHGFRKRYIELILNDQTDFNAKEMLQLV
jgi:hypothetical protein